ncbi:MAG: acyl carrier protein [Treponema sp.]|nr:acyl carrier protein [Treponema sp.]
MEEKVIALLKRVFECAKIDVNSSTENVPEWDSMHQLSIAFEIESEFGVELEPDEIAEMKSVKEIYSVLERKCSK